MSGQLVSRLFAYVLAPAPATPAAAGSVAGPPPSAGTSDLAAGADHGGRGRAPVRAARRGGHPVPTAVAVLGDATAAGLAVDLAAALVHRERRRCAALVLIWGTPLPPVRRTQPTREAAGLAAAVDAAAGDVARPGGPVVVAPLPDAPAAAIAAREPILAVVGPDTVVVLAVCGPRPAAFDALLAAQALMIAVVPHDAPDALGRLAADALRRVAPQARVTTVVQPVGGLPRPWRHRTAIRAILGRIDG